MLLLLRSTQTPDPRLRNRAAVLDIVRLAAQKERHDLGWWQAWLADHW